MIMIRTVRGATVRKTTNLQHSPTQHFSGVGLLAWVCGSCFLVFGVFLFVGWFGFFKTLCSEEKFTNYFLLISVQVSFWGGKTMAQILTNASPMLL